MNAKPPPPATHTAAPWQRDAAGQVRLLASREIGSQAHFFPPLPEASPIAGRFRTVALSPTAKLYSFTVIHPNPKTGRKPFALAYADFPEQVRVFGALSLEGSAPPRIGSALAVEAGDGGSYRFVPIQ